MTQELRAIGYEPLEPYPGQVNKWKVRCRCGRVRWIFANNLHGRPQGCRRCGDFGLDLEAPALVYLIQSVELGALKIGVTGLNTTRLAAFGAIGWEQLALHRVEAGWRAVAAEQTILDWWRIDLLLPPFLGREATPHGGWTETVDEGAVSIPDVLSRLSAAVADARDLNDD